MTNELARFVAGIHACRRRQFSLLTQNGPHSPLAVALREGIMFPDFPS
jgi:hypothetical protein